MERNAYSPFTHPGPPPLLFLGLDINRVYFHPEQWQWPGLIDLPPPDQPPDLTAAGGKPGPYITAARQK